jgi:hypothetical protein
MRDTMNAKKLKIRVKTGKFSIPIPALPFSTVRWIFKLIFKYYPSKVSTGSTESGKKEVMETILNNLTYQDIEHIFDQLEQTKPFKIVDIEADDENEGRVMVEICTI